MLLDDENSSQAWAAHLAHRDVAGAILIEELECISDHGFRIIEIAQTTQIAHDLQIMLPSVPQHRLEVASTEYQKHHHANHSDCGGGLVLPSAEEQKDENVDYISCRKSKRADFVDRLRNVALAQNRELMDHPRLD